MKKKKTVFILLLLFIVLLQIGIIMFFCFNYFNKNTIELYDDNAGLKALFRFNKDYKYILTSVDNINGKYSEIHVKNEDLNIDFDAYFSETSKEEYYDTKESRKERRIFREYKFGNYDAYLYANDIYDAYLTILLNDSYSITINIGRLDETKEFDLEKILEAKEFIDFFKSIKVYRKRTIKIGT